MAVKFFQGKHATAAPNAQQKERREVDPAQQAKFVVG
jgi:hypothetical protein